MIHPYTVCLTSCERFDLLERTLATLLPRLETPCEEIIIGEDSGNAEVMTVVEQFKNNTFRIPIRVIFNCRRLGICRNIDRIYTEVKTDWVFHSEDDWEFHRSGFVQESFRIMYDETVAAVILRDISDFPEDFWLPQSNGGGGRYYIANPAVAGSLSGLHFSPGLRRMSDYRAIGPYDRLVSTGQERDVSFAYLKAGKRLAMLMQPAVRHIGYGRHVHKSRLLREKAARFVRKRRHRFGLGPPPPPRP